MGFSLLLFAWQMEGPGCNAFEPSDAQPPHGNRSGKGVSPHTWREHRRKKGRRLSAKQINIQNFEQIRKILNAAVSCRDNIGAHDVRGSAAGAKSILGPMSFDCSRPVKVVGENEAELCRVCEAVH